MSENTYQMDGFVYISPNYDETSSNSNYFLSVGGDTMRVLNQRTPTSSGNGFIGEIVLTVTICIIVMEQTNGEG